MVVEELRGNASGFGKLTGSISVDISNLSGVITADKSLTGQLDLNPEYGTYMGPYEVIPKAFKSQTLETKNKVLKENVLVLEVPYWETSNEDGLTAYIAQEV